MAAGVEVEEARQVMVEVPAVTRETSVTVLVVMPVDKRDLLPAGAGVGEAGVVVGGGVRGKAVRGGNTRAAGDIRMLLGPEDTIGRWGVWERVWGISNLCIQCKEEITALRVRGS